MITYGNNSKLFSDTDSVIYEIKTEDENVYENLSSNKEMFDFSNYSTKSKYYDSNKLFIEKVNNKNEGVATETFVGLKSEMPSYLANDNSKDKKAKGVNRNVVVEISHNEYKDLLSNKNVLDIRWIGFKVKIIK